MEGQSKENTNSQEKPIIQEILDDKDLGHEFKYFLSSVSEKSALYPISIRDWIEQNNYNLSKLKNVRDYFEYVEKSKAQIAQKSEEPYSSVHIHPVAETQPQSGTQGSESQQAKDDPPRDMHMFKTLQMVHNMYVIACREAATEAYISSLANNKRINEIQTEVKQWDEKMKEMILKRLSKKNLKKKDITRSSKKEEKEAEKIKVVLDERTEIVTKEVNECYKSIGENEKRVIREITIKVLNTDQQVLTQFIGYNPVYWLEGGSKNAFKMLDYMLCEVNIELLDKWLATSEVFQEEFGKKK